MDSSYANQNASRFQRRRIHQLSRAGGDIRVAVLHLDIQPVCLHVVQPSLQESASEMSTGEVDETMP